MKYLVVTSSDLSENNNIEVFEDKELALGHINYLVQTCDVEIEYIRLFAGEEKKLELSVDIKEDAWI